MTRNTDNAVLNKDGATNNAKIKINAMEWYVPHYTPSLEEYNKLMNKIVRKTPTNLHYSKKSVFLKQGNTQNFWTCELGTQEGVNVPVWIPVVFQQKDTQHDQNLNNDTFYRISAQCIIGAENYLDSGILLNYDDDDCSQRCAQIKEAFKAVTKDNILQPYKSEDYFRSSNDGDNFGYNVQNFVIRYQKNFESAQPIKVKFKFSENIPDGIYGYALVLTNGLVSIGSDEQRMCDLGYI